MLKNRKHPTLLIYDMQTNKLSKKQRKELNNICKLFSCKIDDVLNKSTYELWTSHHKELVIKLKFHLELNCKKSFLNSFPTIVPIAPNIVEGINYNGNSIIYDGLNFGGDYGSIIKNTKKGFDISNEQIIILQTRFFNMTTTTYFFEQDFEKIQKRFYTWQENKITCIEYLDK